MLPGHERSCKSKFLQPLRGCGGAGLHQGAGEGGCQAKGYWGDHTLQVVGLQLFETLASCIIDEHCSEYSLYRRQVVKLRERLGAAGWKDEVNLSVCASDFPT